MPDRYFDDRYELDDEYEQRKRKRSEAVDKTLFDEREAPPIKERREEVKRRATSTTLRLQDKEIQPMKRFTPEVFGNLFDRLQFIKERIDELNENIKVREELHEDTIKEIDKDIVEKETLGGRTNDIDEVRNLKMDISVLRKEKRHENVQFWKDLFELKTELRELLEKYETEKKMVDIFKDLGGER